MNQHPAIGPERFNDAGVCARRLVERLQGRVCMALPLGIGKPAAFVNALYQQACENPEIELKIFTALSLDLPKPGSELERRFLEPLLKRVYTGVPELDYLRDLRRGRLPANVCIEEFYFRPGAFLGVPVAQQNYTSTNYTHAARDLVTRGVNVIAQMVAPHPDGERLSLSCNPDITIDLLERARVLGMPLPVLVGETNARLPYMPGDAELAADRFDLLIEGGDYPLFPVPNSPVSLTEHAIGLRVAGLIRDSGTLQIGIGGLGAAVSWAIGLRRRDNAAYRRLIDALDAGDTSPERDDLPVGLYGLSEMFTEGFLHLRECGVLRRTVDEGVYLHAGFYLGSARFYDRLRELSDEDRAGIDMTRISFTNQLYGNEEKKRAQRCHARFVNSAMMVTLSGAVVSDGLEDGRVVSGVGGQYNFVAMAHEIENARSIIMLPATRTSAGVTYSNILGSYGHTTVPRHLRDIVVTEYGVADLRGASDKDVIAALLNITDSRFQESLRAQAVASGKLPSDYRIPPHYRSNYPQNLADKLAATDRLDLLPFYPLHSDFTEAEAALAIALNAIGSLKGNSLALLRLARRGARFHGDPRLTEAMGRMGLVEPRGIRQRVYRALLAGALMEAVFDSGRPLFT